MSNKVNSNKTNSDYDSDCDPETQGMYDEVSFCYTTDTDRFYLHDSDIDDTIVGEDEGEDELEEEVSQDYDSDAENHRVTTKTKTKKLKK